ncbi:MAG: cell envelope integrity protein TolA [Desulfuromonas thiophila]|jgi:outer membrane biosynthesis protein TonB|nr:cell envelope integrity protein TolA [Desulfuromonas thiophila]
MSTEQGVSAENSSVPGGLRRTLFVSLGLHLLLLALALSGWQFHRQKPRPQVYQVNLLHKPVMRPQAGRPDAPTKPQKPAVKPVAPARPPQPAKPKAPPKPAEPKAKVPPPAKQPPQPVPPKPADKPAPKSEPKAVTKQVVPAKTAPVTKAKEVAKSNIDQQYEDVEDAIEAMRRRNEREKLKQKIQALSDGPMVVNSGISAPPGQVGGSGDQKGTPYHAWIAERLRQEWVVYPNERGLKVSLVLSFYATGALKEYRIVKSSGNSSFDQRVLNAVMLFKNEPLPSAPGKPLTLEILFDPQEGL